MPVRKAKHAGSWYSDSGNFSTLFSNKTQVSFAGIELSNQLESWLQKANYVHGPARALIAP